MFNIGQTARRLALAAVGATISSGLAAQEYTFAIQHFLSPKAPAQTVLIEPWARAVEQASGGRIAFEIFPAMSLGGAPPELYNQVRDGVVDIVWTLPGYTAGTFPRLEVFELPGVHGGDARATNMAIQQLMAEIAPDLDQIHPLLVHVHTGNALHLAHEDVQRATDLAGLKVRSPSRTGAWLLAELGAEPVGMPVPALPQALSKGTVDAGLLPFEVAIPLGLAELTDYSVELAGGDRFGTSTFLFAMNKNSYASLPTDLQKILDDHSGPALAEAMGTAWNEIEPIGMALATDAGKSVAQLSQVASDEFVPAFDATVARWVEEARRAGVDAEELLRKAREAVAAQER